MKPSQQRSGSSIAATSRRPWLLALACLLALASAPLAAVEIELPESFPMEGKQVAIVVTEAGVPVPGIEIVVHYNPNSQTTRKEALALTDANGATTWTPLTPSVVRLDAVRPASGGSDAETLGSLNTSVRFDRFPLSGIAIMTLAAILLFGGAIVGLISLMSSGSANLLEQPEPPST